MIIDRYAHYLAVFKLACRDGGSGRQFIVTSANQAGRAGGEIPATLEELLLAGLGPTDFVFLFDVLQKLDDVRLTEALEGLSATGCNIFVVVPLRYSERLLDDGTNENKLVETRDWWADRLRRHFSSNEAVKTLDENEAAFATWAVPVPTRAAIEALSPRRRIGKLLDRLRNSAVILHRRLAQSLSSKADILDALAGKSISVVGNARSLGGSQSGPRIDANDIVLRFNLAPIISHASHGHRTDWLATSVPLDPEFIKSRGASRVLWMSPYRRKMTRRMLAADNLYIHPRGDVAHLARRAGVARPSTGLMMIDLLVQSQCNSVELYGFDFYKSQSFSGHQTADNTPHAFDKEEAFVLSIAAKDPRFKICS